MVASPAPLLEEIDKLQGKLDFLRASDGLSSQMHTLLRMALQRVKRGALAFPRLALEDQSVHGPEILLSFMEIERTIEILEGKGRSQLTRFRPVLEEAVSRILGPDCTPEFVVVTSPRDNRALACNFNLDDHHLSFILFLSPSVDYSEDRLVVRAIHEIAHAESQIRRLVEQRRAEPRRLGEALCDLLGLFLAGPAFLRSAALVVTIFGPDYSLEFSETHPSLVCRARVLESVARQIWTSANATRAAKAALATLGDLHCGPDEVIEFERLRLEVHLSVPHYEPM